METKPELTKCSKLIREIRHTLCISQQDFAKLIEIGSMSISHYEHARRYPSIPTLKNIIGIANDNGYSLTANDFELPMKFMGEKHAAQ